MRDLCVTLDSMFTLDSLITVTRGSLDLFVGLLLIMLPLLLSVHSSYYVWTIVIQFSVLVVFMTLYIQLLALLSSLLQYLQLQTECLYN